MRESETRRVKLANAPTEEEITDLPKKIEVADASEKEFDMSDVRAEIEEIAEARLKVERQKRKDGKRVEKQARLKIRRQCCGCGEMAGVKSDGKTGCCKHICATCF